MSLCPRLLIVAAVASLGIIGGAAADPVAKQLDASATLPAGIAAKGKRVVQAWTWTDKNGPGHLVLSTTQRDSKKGTGRQLFAQVYAGAKPRQTRLVRDAVENCQLDLVASFVTGSVAVSDIDGDGTAEVSFAYDLDCDAKADGSPRKLIILEGTAKHALRGTSRGTDPDDKPIGGEYKADPFKGQEALGTWAETRWNELLSSEPVGVDP